MPSPVRAVLLLALLSSAACGGELAGPADAGGGLTLSATPQAVGSVVSGDVQIDDLAAFGEEWERHTYHAETLTNRNQARGSFRVRIRWLGNFAEDFAAGRVVCLVVEPDGRTARLAGVIEETSIPGFVGLGAVWTVVDQGLAGDQTTDIAFAVSLATAMYHCRTGFGTGEFASFQTVGSGGLTVAP